jgi:hypothetical protein
LSFIGHVSQHAPDWPERAVWRNLPNRPRRERTMPTITAERLTEIEIGLLVAAGASQQ